MLYCIFSEAVAARASLSAAHSWWAVDRSSSGLEDAICSAVGTLHEEVHPPSDTVGLSVSGGEERWAIGGVGVRIAARPICGSWEDGGGVIEDEVTGAGEEYFLGRFVRESSNAIADAPSAWSSDAVPSTGVEGRVLGIESTVIWASCRSRLMAGCDSRTSGLRSCNTMVAIGGSGTPVAMRAKSGARSDKQRRPPPTNEDVGCPVQQNALCR